MPRGPGKLIKYKYKHKMENFGSEKPNASQSEQRGGFQNDSTVRGGTKGGALKKKKI